MNPKKIHGKESRQLMLEAVNELADVVGSTMGAKGRNVLLEQQDRAPQVINDGVSIIREIFFEDKLKNAVAELVKDAASRTNDLAGDGTTTATVLTRAIIREGLKRIAEGANPVLLRREIEEAAKKVVAHLFGQRKMVESAEEVVKIAQVSMQDQEAGKIIGEVMFEVGADSAVTVKKSPLKQGIFVEKSGGMKIDGSIVSGWVGNKFRWETKFENAHVLLLKDSPEDHEFESKWVPFLRQLTEAQRQPNGEVVVTKVHVPYLVIIAEKLSHRLEMALSQNINIVKYLWFRPNTWDKNMTEVFQDLGALLGTKAVCETDGVFLQNVKVADLGTVEQVIADRHQCVLAVSADRSKSDEFLDRLNIVKEQIENAESEEEKEQIRKRYAALSGGIVEILASTLTEQETKELHLRLEDAIGASRGALEEGYVPGGGVALLNARQTLRDDCTAGAKVIMQACMEPIRQILQNAGYENPENEVEKLQDGEGINVLTDEKVDMIPAGIVDPLKVVRLAFLNAVSVAGLLITSEFTVTDAPKNDIQKVREIINQD